ncbi:hypothetical protein ABOC32_06350 [Pseudomonas sp. WOUb67]|uniref:hypothetical protein n=1 Tax=Pseudomonas sp. WOUb67 TaxID=3161136 RepID=UPI003CED7A7F
MNYDRDELMILASGSTRQTLAAVNAKIDSIAMAEAESLLARLICNISFEELAIVAPELREAIDRFLPKRKRKLQKLLGDCLKTPASNDSQPQRSTTPLVELEQKSEQGAEQELENYKLRLNKLETSHIFQWATYYRDTVGFIYKDIYDNLERADDWSSTLGKMRDLFAEHSTNIASRGISYSKQHGLSEEAAQYKSLSGLQQFLYLIMNLYVDSQEKISNASQARLYRNIGSALLCGVLEGYAEVLSWNKLCEHHKHWVPALGFTTGADALLLMQRNEKTIYPLIGLFDTIVPLLLAVDALFNKYNGHDHLVTRVSRIHQTTPISLEITLFSVVGGITSEFSVVAVFSGDVTELVEVEYLGINNSTLAVLRASPIVISWIEQHDKRNLIDASSVSGLSERAHDLSELVRGGLEKLIEFNSELEGSQLIRHNYAKDFPLEDPDTRRLFTVERHSVRVLLEKFERGTGIHLWCSVRRSGKTTAATSLSGRSLVIFQTMDQVTDQVHHNIFEREIRAALESAKPIASDFFENVITACLAGAGAERTNSKVIFLLDEYEILFGMLGAMAAQNQMIKFNVALPLLSQMVRFASRNLLIFMGQRPDAYHIIPAQNQLSPLVKQHPFPLFEHLEGGSDSEFSQFLRKVLSQNLPFSSSFADAVYAETSGHPYLTVNLMVDFCDWLATNNAVSSSTLDANRFELFAKARLIPGVLSRSSFYPFFKNQFSGYLSEESRRDELWLYAIARVLHQIGMKNPKVLYCPIARYNEYATQSLAGSTTTPQVLLTSGVLSNFFRQDNGNIRPAVRLMARLAACSTPEVL